MPIYYARLVNYLVWVLMTEPLDDKTLSAINLEEITGFLLIQVSLRWERRIDELVAPLDLTKTQFFVLSMTHFLHQQGGPVTQSQLAQYGGMDLMMISQVARRLEGKGHIQREDHPSDSRAKMLVLTSQGKERMIAARRAVKQGWGEFIGAMEQGDEQLRQGLEALYKSHKSMV